MSSYTPDAADPARGLLVVGVVATDGLIGTLARLDDPSRAANRCFTTPRWQCWRTGDQDGVSATRASGPGKYTDSCPSCQRTR